MEVAHSCCYKLLVLTVSRPSLKGSCDVDVSMESITGKVYHHACYKHFVMLEDAPMLPVKHNSPRHHRDVPFCRCPH